MCVTTYIAYLFVCIKYEIIYLKWVKAGEEELICQIAKWKENA